MNSDINFKRYWKKQKVEAPNPSKVIQQSNKYKRKTLIRLILANITMISTCVFIGFIWYYYQPRFLTTKIGIIICIIDMIIFLIYHNNLRPLLIKKRVDLSLKEHLKQLKKLKTKQYYQGTTLLNVYFIFLFIGLSLYLYEYVSKMNIIWAITCYLLILFWVGISAFYFRPKTLEKNQNALKELIKELNEIEKQLYE